jgi:hypothetical protein
MMKVNKIMLALLTARCYITGIMKDYILKDWSYMLLVVKRFLYNAVILLNPFDKTMHGETCL